MALTVSNLIDNALALAFPFVPEYGVAKGQLLRRLNALEQEIVLHYTMHAPERIALSGVVIVDSANNITGHTLQATAQSMYDFKLFDGNGLFQANIRIVPDRQFDAPPVHPAAVIRGNTLLPCDPFGERWASTPNSRPWFRGDGDEIRYRYVPAPTQITTLSATLASPDEARQYIEHSLALQILVSTSASLPVPQEVIANVARSLESAKLDLALHSVKRTDTKARSENTPWQ